MQQCIFASGKPIKRPNKKARDCLWFYSDKIRNEWSKRTNLGSDLPIVNPAIFAQAGIDLNDRSRSAQAFTVEPRSVEAANASLPGSEHRAGVFDPARARLFLFGGGDPVDPIPARIGRDVRPQRPRLRGGRRESFFHIGRHLGFRVLCRWRDLERDDVACLCARSFA
jgi:hypothetical protein